MKFALADKDWKILKKIALDPLKEKNARLWVFGSRARGDQQQFSDIDILIEPSKDLDARFLAEIRHALDESDLTIKVDLVLDIELTEAYRPQALKERTEI